MKLSYMLLKKKKLFVFIVREEGRETERGRNVDVREKHGLLASRPPQTGDLACSTGMCPDWESNR